MTTKERDAWAVAYRIYDEYAPKLRNTDNEMANSIFQTVSNRLSSLYNESDNGGQLILLGVYDILGNVYENAKNTSN